MEARKEEWETASKRQAHMIMMKEEKGEEQEEKDEDDEDLFEINLEIVNKIPPPQYYWESCYFTATTNTLLANCLLPAADVSSAVPIVMTSSPAIGEDHRPTSFRYNQMKV